MDLYRELGLNLQPAVNAAEACITEVWNLLVFGPAQGDGQYDKLVSGIPEVSPG